ncbi:MAG: TolC family protein [Candidatus Zhuqueibacterota bacterium]
MAKKTIFVIILFFVPIITELQAGDSTRTDSLTIRLQDAVLMALEANPTLLVQRLDPDIARTYAREQRAAFDPAVTLSASRSETKSLRFLGSRPEPFELTSERIQYDMSLTQLLPTGTSLAATASVIGSISSIYTDQYSGDVNMTMTQSLLQGFGTGYNLASLRKAKLDAEISALELKAVAEQLTADVEKAYWDLYLAKQEIAIQQRSLELAEKQMSESRERVNVGRLPELELAAVHAEAATRKESMIDAQSRYDQARLHLIFLLNPPSGQSWDVVPVLVDVPMIPIDSLAASDIHEELAMKYRPDLLQAKLNIKKNKADLARTRNGLLPRLDLFITLGRTTYAQSFNESIPDIHSPYSTVSGGLTFEFPLPNRQARAEHARSKYQREQVEISLKNMERLVQWDVRAAYIEAVRSRQQIEATRVARDLQEKKLDAELEKFRVGKSTNYLVLQAQRDFIASQLDEARANVGHINAIVDLQLMEGTLLERRGIETFSVDRDSK